MRRNIFLLLFLLLSLSGLVSASKVLVYFPSTPISGTGNGTCTIQVVNLTPNVFFKGYSPNCYNLTFKKYFLVPQGNYVVIEHGYAYEVCLNCSKVPVLSESDYAVNVNTGNIYAYNHTLDNFVEKHLHLKTSTLIFATILYSSKIVFVLPFMGIIIASFILWLLLLIQAVKMKKKVNILTTYLLVIILCAVFALSIPRMYAPYTAIFIEFVLSTILIAILVVVYRTYFVSS